MTGISGVHALIYSSEPDQMRAFFRDVLELPSVDAGGGWLIFALPPAEVAVHPIDGAGHHELFLMCDDIEGTVANLREKGVQFTTDVSDRATWLRYAASGSRIRLCSAAQSAFGVDANTASNNAGVTADCEAKLCPSLAVRGRTTGSAGYLGWHPGGLSEPEATPPPAEAPPATGEQATQE